ncbi:endonuclease/exonuclease/phosphatase family protein [Nonomuraea harbinensis]|uniref:Endonuclease/exonuclease/phosphatase family protein n=1 Tax=Nonomuraea harbinensis TaxID=1286938 RepID=A0ABW1BSU7_9ACTN|nr:endonuclease/exonuclease/phosphatase family protein [Nonomuraea harbinensis]
MTTLRIGTYNLRGLRDDVPALVRVISVMGADLVCLQEAPRLAGWRARCRALAARCGLRLVAGQGVAGVAVLAAPWVRPVHAESRLLRVFLGLEPRGLAMAVVRAGPALLAVGSVHLDLDGRARLHHAAEAVARLRRMAAPYGAPVVLGGDVNESPHQPAWRYLAGQLTDCYAAAPRGDGLTFSSRRPLHRIDGLFAAPGIQVVSCGGVDASGADLAGATDHLPVVAEVRLGE